MSATATVTDLPPGPSGVGVLRELAALRRDQLRWIEDRRARWGDVFALHLGRLPGPPLFSFATTPEPIRTVLTDSATFSKSSPVYENMADVLGDGLLTSQGEDWKQQRRTLQPLFTRRRVDAYGDAFVEAARSVVATWADGTTVDLDRQMQTVSLRSVSTTLFGTDVTDQVAPIVAATDRVSHAVVRAGTAPVQLPHWVPTPDHRAIADGRADLHRRFDELIEQRRRQDPDGDDLLGLLLQVTDPETGQGLSHAEIRDQAGVMLLAGYDTTSTALTFALHLLGQHPDWQERARDQVRDVCGDRLPTTAGAGELELVRRVVDEALRLHPSAYITSRSATRDTEVAGYRMPRGGVVATSFHALHRHPDLWEDPTRFDPDRFLPDAVRDRDPYAYLPFGGGPRSCIGNHFALLEATLGLATILQQVRLEARTGHVPVVLGITQRPAAEVRTHVTRVA